MHLEAELKAELSPDVRRAMPDRLQNLAGARGDLLEYDDTYFDLPDGSLQSSERELRLRVVSGRRNGALLTWKDSPFDAATLSKPEIEAAVESPPAMRKILLALGYRPWVRVRKHCLDFSLDYRGLAVAATLVDLPGLGRSFLEVEHCATSREAADSALSRLAGLLEELGVPPQSVTTEYYTDMFLTAAPSSRGAAPAPRQRG